MDLPGFDMRYTVMPDEAYLRKWLAEPGMVHWFPMIEGQELDDAVACWIGFSRWSCSLTATINGTPVAIGTLFLMPYQKIAHHCLFKMIVDPAHQRKGIGASLLKNLKNLAKNYFRIELMHIEVWDRNPIIDLLKKQGFTEYVRQENYVKEGDTYMARVLLECFL